MSTSAALLERPIFEADLWSDDDDTPEAVPATALSALSAAEESRDDARFDGERALFNELADELAEATRGLSSTRLAARHPAYSEILALGDQAIPLLLERVRDPGDRPLWLHLLGSLTPFPASAGKDTVAEAAAAWVALGKRLSLR
jgi:hypothetical protein